MAMAVYGMAVVLAPAIGPTLGGFITDNFSWRWVFFINVPVGIALAHPLEPHRHRPAAPQARRTGARRARVDWSGLGLIASGLGALEYVLDKGQEDDWFHSSAIVGFTIVAVVVARLVRVLGAAARQPDRRPAPLQAAKLRRRRTRSCSSSASRSSGSTVLLPQYLQVLDGLHRAAIGHGAVAGRASSSSCSCRSSGGSSSKVDVRALITIGFVEPRARRSSTWPHKLDLQMDFRTAVELRTLPDGRARVPLRAHPDGLVRRASRRRSSTR